MGLYEHLPSLESNKRRLVLHDVVAPAASHLGDTVKTQASQQIAQQNTVKRLQVSQAYR